uniref:Uncharacterized protein n=1 Tax=Desertifilum tharense IPPAS B-1220 TaxID=1781255 RepID=A0ACD5GN82_9CYAN
MGLTISGQTYNWTFDQWLWDSWVTERTKTSRTLAAEVLLETGTPFSFSGTADQAEWARLDYIEFIPVGDWSGFMPPDELTGVELVRAAFLRSRSVKDLIRLLISPWVRIGLG